MYHVELRQFPHNFCRFNMSAQELRQTLLDAWARGETVEFGERHWDPRRASLTVLEGARLSLPELAMGRGWRSAQRRSSDVTAALLADRGSRLASTAHAPASEPPAAVAVGSSAQPSASGSPLGPSDATPAAAESLAAELLALLGDEREPLLRAWLLALERHPDRSASECLALAEEFLRD